MSMPIKFTPEMIKQAINDCSDEDALVLVVVLIVIINKIPLDLNSFLGRLRVQLQGLDFIETS